MRCDEHGARGAPLRSRCRGGSPSASWWARCVWTERLTGVPRAAKPAEAQSLTADQKRTRRIRSHLSGNHPTVSGGDDCLSRKSAQVPSISHVCNAPPLEPGLLYRVRSTNARLSSSSHTRPGRTPIRASLTSASTSVAPSRTTKRWRPYFHLSDGTTVCAGRVLCLSWHLRRASRTQWWREGGFDVCTCYSGPSLPITLLC